MIKIELDRVQGDFGFNATDADGHKIAIDGSPEIGGSNYGIRPMQMLLAALGGCSGIDVISILKKKRQTIEIFKMIIVGEREKEVIPALWKKIEIEFLIGGQVTEENAIRSIELSIEKYCSVAETLRRGGTEITWKLTLL